MNQRAFAQLTPALLHFYARCVKIANFQTGGNVSKQFQYFAGRWNRQTIYKNLAKLRKLGFMKQHETKKRNFKPVAGKKRYYINSGILKHVRSKQDTFFLKCALFLVNYQGNFNAITHREIKAARFSSEAAELLYRYIHDHLDKGKLNKLYNAVMWGFRQTGKLNKKIREWMRGSKPRHPLGNRVPKWRHAPGRFILKKLKKASNAPPGTAGSMKSDEEPANPAGHPAKTGSWPETDGESYARIFAGHEAILAGIDKLATAASKDAKLRSVDCTPKHRDPDIATPEDYRLLNASLPWSKKNFF